MSKGKIKFPLSGITGSLLGADRTIGIDPGLASSFARNTTMSKNDTKMGYTTKLVSQTKATRGGSTARHDRASVYCGCDVSYKGLGNLKQSFIEPWWRTVMNDPNSKMSGYHAFMKCCLKYLKETEAFSNFSYVSRFMIWNNSGVEWVNEPLHFMSIPTFRADGADVAAYKLLLQTTKKGTISYDPLMIDVELTHTVPARGEMMVVIPLLKMYDVAQIDVYSYHPE